MVVTKLSLSTPPEHSSIDAAFGVPICRHVSRVAPLQGAQRTALQLILQPQQVEEERFLRGLLRARNFQRRENVPRVSDYVDLELAFIAICDGTRCLLGGRPMNDFMHGDLQDQGAVGSSYNRVSFGSQSGPHNLFGGSDLKVE